MYMLKIVEKEIKPKQEPLIRDINITENDDKELESKNSVNSATPINLVALDEDIKQLRFEP